MKYTFEEIKAATEKAEEAIEPIAKLVAKTYVMEFCKALGISVEEDPEDPRLIIDGVHMTPDEFENYIMNDSTETLRA